MNITMKLNNGQGRSTEMQTPYQRSLNEIMQSCPLVHVLPR